MLNLKPNANTSQFRNQQVRAVRRYAALLLTLIFCTASFTALTGATAIAHPDAPADTTPVLSTYYGGSTEECLFSPCAIAVDKAGNIYFSGTTRSEDFPLVNPYSSDATRGDLFLVKLTAGTYAVEYSTYIGPGEAHDLAVDSDGNAYLVGWTSDKDFPTTDDAVQSDYAGGIDAVVVKISADGSELLYSTFLGGTKRDEGRGIDVDSSGNIYVTGQTDSTDFVTANPYQATPGGFKDVFVAKFSATGALQYSTYLGGEKDDKGWRIVAGGNGTAYLTGQVGSDDFPTTPGVVQPDRHSGAGFDAIVTKMTAGGDLAFSTFFNQTGTEEGIDLAIDGAGASYLLTRRHGVVKFNPEATAILYQTEINVDTDVNSQGGIAVDDDGIAYVTGWTGSGSGHDLVLAAINKTGRPIHHEMLGGGDTDHGHDIALFEDEMGHKTAYIAGASKSPDFPTVNPVQGTLNGQIDAVIVAISGIETIRANFIYLPAVRNVEQ